MLRVLFRLCATNFTYTVVVRLDTGFAVVTVVNSLLKNNEVVSVVS